jgi:OOP family OmpA-OmpF porin
MRLAISLHPEVTSTLFWSREGETNMKTKQVVAAGALSIAIGLPGAAIGEGLYIGGAIGNSSFKQGCDELPAGLSCKKTDYGWKGFAGYQFTRNWGIEAGYSDFGKTKANGTFMGLDTSAEARVWGFGLAGTGTLPLSSQFDLLGKLGVFHGVVDVSANVGGITGKLSGRSNTALVGAGARWNFSGNWGARVEWERINKIGDSTSGTSDVDFISIGIEYRL